GQSVRLAETRAQALGNLTEQNVPNGVAQAVVDQLEAIEVKIQQGHEMTGACRPGECLLQPVGQQPAVGQSGQFVGKGLALQSRFGFAFCQIAKVQLAQHPVEVHSQLGNLFAAPG